MEDQKMIEMFHAMYDNFPTRARLIRKNREVLAVNKIAEAEGLRAGVRCVDQPPPEAHRFCRANQALKEHRGKFYFAEDGTVMFWAPLEGCDDVYVHGSLHKDRPNPIEERNNT